VLLAEVCVQDCEVIDICEMVRRFVITWPSMRYWTDYGTLPGLNAIGRAIERLCCELRGKLGSGCAPTGDDLQNLAMITRSGGTFAPLLTSRFAMAASDSPFGALGQVMAQIEPLATAKAMIPGGTVTAIDPAVERTIQTRVHDAVTTAMAATAHELAALRAEVARLSAARPA
jgi:hypothetical protein